MINIDNASKSIFPWIIREFIYEKHQYIKCHAKINLIETLNIKFPVIVNKGVPDRIQLQDFIIDKNPSLSNNALFTTYVYK